jgi:hypothetical protein
MGKVVKVGKKLHERGQLTKGNPLGACRGVVRVGGAPLFISQSVPSFFFLFPPLFLLSGHKHEKIALSNVGCNRRTYVVENR